MRARHIHLTSVRYSPIQNRRAWIRSSFRIEPEFVVDVAVEATPQILCDLRGNYQPVTEVVKSGEQWTKLLALPLMGVHVRQRVLVNTAWKTELQAVAGYFNAIRLSRPLRARLYAIRQRS